MSWNLTEATEYIRLNTLDNEDFIDADDTRKTAVLNVSKRELTRKFNGCTIPDEAVYIFAAVLASAFNDTNKMQQQGVAGFAVKGVSFTFKDWAKKPVESMIPPEVYVMVGAPTGRTIKWTVL
uniref:Uncharacterized protein n=1 Tax=Peribacillus huizhouensis TaxID=1501239 RepID=A0ABR6CT46_9BACI|nr:hypothetical protein [Peribacillus huizhouensis]MBA9027522.1 hypothetical protein [Peribacillus huizhouensis]